MALLLKGAHVVDPQVGIDGICDVLVEEGKIARVGEGLEASGALVRDLAGKYMIPGMVDMHVHLREPGFEQKEDIKSGTRAAVHGGFTGVCCMPNTKPNIDNGVTVEAVKSIAAAEGACHVHISGALTKDRKGETIAEMGDMVKHGVVAFTDDGGSPQDAGIMRLVMDYANQFDKAIMCHCQDAGLVGAGQVNEGSASTRLGILGWPAAGEEIQIARDIALCRLTGTKLHIQHITTARGVDMVRRAKEEGLPVTCEVTPHHLFLNEEALDETYNTSLKVNPPLRTQADNDALIAALLDGTIDCVATDHAPHTAWEKDCEFEVAAFGMTGLETALGLMLTQLISTEVMDYKRLVEVMSIAPRRILGVDEVALREGSDADLTIFDPSISWTVTTEEFESKATNSGFLGAELKGRPTDVYVGGIAKMTDGTVCA